MKLSVKIAGVFAVVAFALTAVSANAAFTRDLTMGSTGADVTELQTWLESKGFLTIPTGVSKGYFGELTKQALIKYQISAGITPAAGYFGPITKAKLAMAGTSTSDDSSNDSADLKGGAGDLTISSKSSGLEDKVLEGDEEVNVLGFEAEANGSDIAITSVKVQLEVAAGNGSSRLNRYADEVQIKLGDEVVGSASVDDFSKDGDVYSKSIAVKGATVKEDDKDRLYVSVTAVNNIDSDDIDQDWTVTLDQVRYEDATGAILTETSNIDEVFSYTDLSSNGDVQLTVSDDDSSINDAHTVEVKDTSDTNGVEILSFTVEAEGSDLALNDLVINLSSTGAGVTEIANDFRLMMDGEEVGTISGSFASSSATSLALTVANLDDDDVIIDKDDSASFTLEADINDIDGAFSNGDSLSATLDSADVDADDENGDNVTDLSGSAESNDIAFAATGIMLSTGDSDSSSRVLNLDTTNVDDQGKFEVVFEVKAFDKTAYVSLTGASTLSTTVGAYAYVENVNANDVAITTGTTTVTLERVSGGTLSGNFVKINAGQTAVLKATVYHDAATAGNYRAQLGQVNFAPTASTTVGVSSQSAVPTSDYQTPSEQILN